MTRKSFLFFALCSVVLLTPSGVSHAQVGNAAPQKCTITANPPSIVLGQTVLVDWVGTNVASGTISYIGPVSAVGHVYLTPPYVGVIIFSGTFTSPQGKVTCSASVSVTARSASAPPSIYQPGGTYPGGAYSPGDTYTAPPSQTPTTQPTTPTGYTAPTQYNTPTQYKSNSFNTGSFPGAAQNTATNPVSVTTGNTSNTITEGIVPCGNSSSYINATECNLCDFGTLLQRLMGYLVFITFPVAVAVFAFAGFLYFTSTGNPAQIKRARKLFKDIFLGLLLVLSAFLIVQTILNALSGNNFFQQNWATLPCVDKPHTDPNARPRDNTFGSLLAQLVTNVSTNIDNAVYNSTGVNLRLGSGQTTDIKVIGADGQSHTVTFNATQSDVNLAQLYQKVDTQYGTMIDQACASSPVPSCGVAVRALIGAESSGNANTGCNSAGACGLMQLLSSNGGRACDTSNTDCISNQINTGVRQLGATYTKVGNITDTFAGYNGGVSSAVGTSPSGLTPPLAPSQDCPGLLAWQCASNPGGLKETQGYVASICRSMSLGTASKTGCN